MKPRHPLLVFALLAILPQAMLKGEDTGASTAKKRQVPGTALQKEAEKTIREVFKDDFAKSAPADKIALSQKLAAQADETKDDMAGHYQLLLMSANLAAEAGELDAMSAAFDKLAAEFEGDFAAQRKAALGLIIGHAAQDPALVKLAMAYKTLLDKPDDAASCLAVGKYQLFVKHDFERALPLLAKSGHEVLSKLAKGDLVQPAQASAQLGAGDAWWDAVGKSADKDERARFTERAAFWYAKALPSLTGLNKIKVQKRIDTAAAATKEAVASVPKPAPEGVANNALPPGAEAPVKLPGEAAAPAPAKPTPPRGTALSAEEARAQADFKTAYNNPDKSARKTACALLANAYHTTSWQLLASAALKDPDDSVRLVAFTTLAKVRARNGSQAYMLAQCFSALKPAEGDLRLEFARALAPVEFKYEITAAMVEVISKMVYPNVPTTTTSVQGLPSGNPEAVRKVRRHFEAMLAAFNAVAKSEIDTASYEVPRKVKAWWEANMAQFAKADRELAEKYKKDDAQAVKSNP
ncbi:MAG TPA: hypothetical protein VKX17_04445 [Planctomycetota bacterium]|nr:hypothetical protein [Planctomycetota bacterium]